MREPPFQGHSALSESEECSCLPISGPQRAGQRSRRLKWGQAYLEWGLSGEKPELPQDRVKEVSLLVGTKPCHVLAFRSPDKELTLGPEASSPQREGYSSPTVLASSHWDSSRGS